MIHFSTVKNLFFGSEKKSNEQVDLNIKKISLYQTALPMRILGGVMVAASSFSTIAFIAIPIGNAFCVISAVALFALGMYLLTKEYWLDPNYVIKQKNQALAGIYHSEQNLHPYNVIQNKYGSAIKNHELFSKQELADFLLEDLKQGYLFFREKHGRGPIEDQIFSCSLNHQEILTTSILQSINSLKPYCSDREIFSSFQYEIEQTSLIDEHELYKLLPNCNKNKKKWNEVITTISNSVGNQYNQLFNQYANQIENAIVEDQHLASVYFGLAGFKHAIRFFRDSCNVSSSKDIPHNAKEKIFLAGLSLTTMALSLSSAAIGVMHYVDAFTGITMLDESSLLTEDDFADESLLDIEESVADEDDL